MMRPTLILVLLGLLTPAWGQDAGTPTEPKTPQVDATWPGLVLQIPGLQRIAGNRLLIFVRIFATAKAPVNTLIGTPGVVPANASALDLLRTPVPQPYSLQGATMIEEKTQQKFGMLPIEPLAPFYQPSTILSSVGPGQVICLTCQFPIPPPPPPDESGKVPKQTVSIFLPNATGPIKGVVIPPPGGTPPSP